MTNELLLCPGEGTLLLRHDLAPPDHDRLAELLDAMLAIGRWEGEVISKCNEASNECFKRQTLLRGASAICLRWSLSTPKFPGRSDR